MKAYCPRCKITVSSNVLPTTCPSCKVRFYEPAPAQDLELICHNCEFRVPKGCALYIRPCTVKQLWADQIPPPERCPNKEKFNPDDSDFI
jgi:hypothetical protein